MNENSLTASMQELAPIIESAVSNGNMAEITVTGNSMLPILLDRISRVRLIAPIALKRGDIVLYKRVSGAYVLHRIVKIRKDNSLIMCGDNQYILERGIEPSQIIAKADAFARKDRWISCDSTLYCAWWKIHLLFRRFRHIKAKLVGTVK